MNTRPLPSRDRKAAVAIVHYARATVRSIIPPYHAAAPCLAARAGPPEETTRPAPTGRVRAPSRSCPRDWRSVRAAIARECPWPDGPPNPMKTPRPFRVAAQEGRAFSGVRPRRSGSASSTEWLGRWCPTGP